MFPAAGDFYRVLPELILCVFGIVLMLVEPFLKELRRAVLLPLAATGATLALISIIVPAARNEDSSSGTRVATGDMCSASGG